MKFLSIIFISFFVKCGFSQELKTTELLGIVENYRKIGNIDSAKIVCLNYLQTFQNSEVSIALAKLYSLNKECNLAFDYLFPILCLDSSLTIISDSDFYFLETDSRWGQIEDTQLDLYEKNHKGLFRRDIAKLLLSLFRSDQVFYYHLEVAENLLGTNSIIYNGLLSAQSEINSNNLQKLELIIDSIGWPKSSEVTEIGASTAFLIIQHSNKEIQEKYLGLLTQAACLNEASWKNVALMVDRIKVQNGEEQIYGTQVRFNINTRKNEVFPISDELNVDVRRKSMGLIPLEEYLKYFGISYNHGDAENQKE